MLRPFVLHHGFFVVGGAFVLLDLMREAMRMSDLGLSKAAEWQDINVSQLDRQLQGKEHLSLLRMHKLPMRTIRWFFYLGVVKFGMPPEVRRAALIQLATMAGRRMARAGLIQQHNEEERAS